MSITTKRVPSAPPSSSDECVAGSYTPTTLARMADKLGIPPSTMFTFHRRGEGPRTRKLGKRIIVLPEDEREWYRNLPVLSSEGEE